MQLQSGNYGRGEAPDIAINNNNRVVVTHEHEDSVVLYSAIGYLNNGSLELHNHFPYASRGEVPVVALNDNNQFIAMHDIGDVSYLPTSHVISHFSTDFLPGLNYATWMGENRAVQYKTLQDIVLPGTHDSAAYELFTGDTSSAQWMRGPDWKGFEEVCDNISSGWLGDWLKEKCENRLKNAVPFTQNSIAENITLAQSNDFRKQLEQGIRYFDLRVTYRDPSEYPEKTGYRAYHGLIGNSINTITDDIHTYMESVEKELIIIEVSHLNVGLREDDSRSFTSDEHDGLMQLLVSELGEYIYPRNEMSRDDLLGIQIKELVENGPRIILVYGDKYPFENPDNPYSKYFWNNLKGDPNKLFAGGFTETIDLETQEDKQRDKFNSYLKSDSDKLYRLFQTLTANSDIATLNAVYLLTPYQPTLHILSQDVNHHLATFLKESEPAFPNIIMVDFHEESDVVAQAIKISTACNERAISGEITSYTESLWPPNHKMLPVEIDVSQLISYNPSNFKMKIESVWIEEKDSKSNENIYEANNFEPDWEITSDLSLNLRSERNGKSTGRTYHISLLATDCSGEYRFVTQVNVAHDQRD